MNIFEETTTMFWNSDSPLSGTFSILDFLLWSVGCAAPRSESNIPFQVKIIDRQNLQKRAAEFPVNFDSKYSGVPACLVGEMMEQF